MLDISATQQILLRAHYQERRFRLHERNCSISFFNKKEETLKTFVAFFDDSDEEGSIEMITPFYFTGKLIMSDERRKDAKPITLSNIVRLEKILLAYGNGLVRIYTSTDKLYYFYFEGWSTEARSMMRRLSTRRSIYSSCIPSQKQIKLRRRETIYRPTLNLIDKKKINMD